MSPAATPGASGNTGANVEFTDDVLKNISPYTIAGIGTNSSGTVTIPSQITVPTGLTIGMLSFGDYQPAGSNASTGAGSLELSTSFTLGTSNATLSISNGITRYNGSSGTPLTTGTQTISLNIAVTSSQTWQVGSGTGELIVTGNISTTASQAITRTAGGELELTQNNSATYLGGFILQGGTTVLDNAYALGPGTANITVGGTGATVTSGANLLIGPGVAYSTPVTTVLNAHNPLFTFGGNTGTNSWAGAITMNTGTLDQGITLSGGTKNTDVTTFTSTAVISDAPGAIPADDPVTKTGPGTVILNAHNTFGGIYTNKGGTTVIGVPDALGTGTLAPVFDSATNSTGQASLLSADGVAFGRNVIVQAGTLGTQYGATLGGYQIASSGTWSGNIVLNQNTNLTSGNAGFLDFQGTISDGTTYFAGSAVTKIGNGTVQLSGISNYSGNTTVSAGTLLLAPSGALQGAGAVSVGSSSFFGGAGSVAGPVNVASGGTLFAGSPLVGNGIGALSASGTVSLTSGSTLQIKLQAPTSASPQEGVDNDVIVLQGSGSGFSAGNATLQLLPAYSTFTSSTFANGPITYTIVDGGSSGNIDGTSFAGLPNGVSYTYPSGLSYTVDYSNNDITLTLSNVPEPVGTGVLFLAAPLLTRRRRPTSMRA